VEVTKVAQTTRSVSINTAQRVFNRAGND